MSLPHGLLKEIVVNCVVDMEERIILDVFPEVVLGEINVSTTTT